MTPTASRALLRISSLTNWKRLRIFAATRVSVSSESSSAEKIRAISFQLMSRSTRNTRRARSSSSSALRIDAKRSFTSVRRCGRVRDRTALRTSAI